MKTIPEEGTKVIVPVVPQDDRLGILPFEQGEVKGRRYPLELHIDEVWVYFPRCENGQSMHINEIEYDQGY